MSLTHTKDSIFPEFNSRHCLGKSTSLQMFLASVTVLDYTVLMICFIAYKNIGVSLNPKAIGSVERWLEGADSNGMDSCVQHSSYVSIL